MEKFYNYSKNELINIYKQFQQYQTEILKNQFPSNNDEIKSKMNFTSSNFEFDKIIDSVSLEKYLTNEDDILVLQFDPTKTEKYKRKSILETPDEALNLNTVKETVKFRHHEKRIGTFSKCPFGKSALSYKFVTHNENETNINGEIIKPYSDVVISIRFYSPFRYNQGQNNYGPRFNEEFLVLGSQMLTELRDKISCISNNRRLFDISSNPNQECITNDTNPGFFFITDTFYNDLRNKKNPDYSEVIRCWASKNKLNSDDFKPAVMEKSKFFDLNIRLGYPQVYQHHGNCEHLFTFSSIQIISPDDNLDRSAYPILNTVALSNVILCSMCGTNEYSVIVRESKRQMHDPCHLCRICFENYHYIDGKKIGEFQAYHLNPNEIPNTEEG